VAASNKITLRSYRERHSAKERDGAHEAAKSKAAVRRARRCCAHHLWHSACLAAAPRTVCIFVSANLACSPWRRVIMSWRSIAAGHRVDMGRWWAASISIGFHRSGSGVARRQRAADMAVASMAASDIVVWRRASNADRFHYAPLDWRVK